MSDLSASVVRGTRFELGPLVRYGDLGPPTALWASPYGIEWGLDERGQPTLHIPWSSVRRIALRERDYGCPTVTVTTPEFAFVFEWVAYRPFSQQAAKNRRGSYTGGIGFSAP